jgi:hypothetical protein
MDKWTCASRSDLVRHLTTLVSGQTRNTDTEDASSYQGSRRCREFASISKCHVRSNTLELESPAAKSPAEHYPGQEHVRALPRQCSRLEKATRRANC